MERIRRFMRNWLGFSRTETNGFILFLPILAALILAKPVYKSLQDDPGITKEESLQLDSIVTAWNTGLAQNDSSTRRTLFSFNPNTIGENDLAELGFDERLTKRIVGYRSKGGVFRVKRDLMKMYGMDSTLYGQLYAYIQLPAEIKREEKKSASKMYSPTQTVSYRKNIKQEFDLNKADTMQLKKVFGIGSTLSLRIVKFRDALGGFVNEDQLREVYGLDSLVIERLSAQSYIGENFMPAKINLNTADEKRFAVHPYFKKNIARAIINYRFQHGTFTDVHDIKNISAIPPNLAEKIIPYLTVTD
jgi:competence protein ComEA